MTLIVGVRTTSLIALLSDTRITHPDVTQVEELPGRLKLVMLSPTICVGYAGPAEQGIDHVRRTPMADRAAFNAVVAHLRRLRECDFVVAESSSLRQATIKAGSVHEAPLVYIGDDDAWTALEAIRPTVPLPVSGDPGAGIDPEESFVSTVMSAFRHVLTSPAYPTVAGFQMRVGSRADGFHYLYEAGFTFVNVTGPLNESTAGQFSDAAAGGYSYTVLAPREAGHAVVAVHIQQGPLGFIYAPLHHDRPDKVPEVDQAGLCEYVKEHYGVEIDGLRPINSGFQTPSHG